MRMSHITRIILTILSAFLQINAAEFVKTPKVEKEYDFMCGCKHVFYKNQFEPSENHFSGSTQSTAVSYNGQSDKVETMRESFSELVIPDEVVECSMAGRYSRLTGYFLTEPKKYFKITAEYQLNGSDVWEPLEIKHFSGTPFWRKFDFYFDLVEMTTVKKIKIKVQSPVDFDEDLGDDIVYPLYLDEFRICKYCDGTTSQNVPALHNLESDIGKPIFLSESNYLLNVPTGTNSIKLKPWLKNNAPAREIKINGNVVSNGNFSPEITLDADPEKSTIIYIDITHLFKCENSIYIVEVKKPEGPDATLFNLKTTEGVISPVFYRFQNNYTIMVDKDVLTLKLIPFANDPKATIKVDGQAVETGTESQIVNVPTDRIVSVAVTATDGFTQRTYNVKVEHVKPEVSFTKTTGVGVEKLTNPVIEVQIYPAPKSTQTFTVQYEIDSSSTATIGYDYTLTTGTLTFDQANIKQRIPLTILNDEIPDGGETVIIRLNNPTGGAILGKNPIFTYTIKDLIIYVKSGGSGNGSTWTEAIGDLQEALAVSIPGNEIWMAGSNAGGGMVYKPGPTGSTKNESYIVGKGLSIYGGFPGNSGDEGKRELQNWTTYKTILDGDLNGDDGTYWPPDSDKIDDNSNNVIWVYRQGLSEEGKISLNGLVIKNGNANYWQNDRGNNAGGGIFIDSSNVDIEQCIFKNNHAQYGAAIYGQYCVVTVNRTIIEQNRSAGSGGGCSFVSTAYGEDFLKFTNNHVIGNSSEDGPGGGIYIYTPDEVIFNNNMIVDNKAELSYGGGIEICFLTKYNEVKIINCTIARNSSYSNGGGINLFYTASETPFKIENSIFWENTTTTGATQVYAFNYDNSHEIINYCALKGGMDSTNVHGVKIPSYGNIDCIPDFVNPLNDFQIGTNSNCIDKGTEVGAPATDIEGKGRYDHPSHVNVRSSVDIGAYEYNPAP